ncbi:hypothetical protein NHG34_02075 [Aerococcaceae bacterium NML190938]|nr:hypothetical protein [Aerococcaceae bacterium NML190938]
MNQLIGNYILDINRYFNPFTFVYTFSYELIEELPEELNRLEIVSYSVQAKDVSEVLHYHSMSVWEAIQLIPILSNILTIQDDLNKMNMTKEDYELLKEQLIDPLYPATYYMQPIVVQELSQQKNTNIHVMLGDIELAIFYDSDAHCIKIENQYFGQHTLSLKQSINIDSWAENDLIKKILQIYSHHEVTLDLEHR